MEKVLLIIPAYNEEENILKTYKSILNYVKCSLYNEYIDELEDYLQQYKGLQTLYNIFNNKSKINIWKIVITPQH